MARLNYHHLHVSPSAVSTQIKRIEDELGHALFTRSGRTMRLPEAGRLALSCAYDIFTSGNELVALLRDGVRQQRQVLRIGAVATLSRNLQENFIKPLLSRSDIELVLQSGSLEDLLPLLRVHALDLVLSNRRVHADAEQPWRSRSIARQPVSLVGKPRPKRQAFRFPEDLAEVALLLPGRNSDVRASFDLLCEQHGLRCHVLAEVDDMALLRLLARDSGAVALVPTVVVRDESQSRQLVEYRVVPDLVETFFAITVKRHFEPPPLKALLGRDQADLLGMAG